MVSSFVLSTEMDHDGVMRRSEARDPSVLFEATEIMTEMSAAVCRDIFAVVILLLLSVVGIFDICEL